MVKILLDFFKIKRKHEKPASTDYLLESYQQVLSKIEKGDINYIIKTGVPSCRLGHPPPPKPGVKPYIASGLRYGSLFIKDTELLLEITLHGIYSTSTVFVEITGDQLLERIADYTLLRKGKAFLFQGTLEGLGKARILSTDGYVTGIILETKDITHTGIDAYLYIEEKLIEKAVFNVIYIPDILVEWRDEEYSIRIPGIDRQHRLLVNLVNYLYKSLINGASARVITKVTDLLDLYIKIHFRSEELLMEHFDYPEHLYRKHLEEHREFENAVIRYKEIIDATTAIPTLELFKYLVIWIQDHVRGTDRELGHYLAPVALQA
ncbi:MAG: bacteriohemerythrin [Desulfurococcales archaeon]|nr:bacteriohemerythrin [Desulfurococcales archaeon]